MPYYRLLRETTVEFEARLRISVIADPLNSVLGVLELGLVDHRYELLLRYWGAVTEKPDFPSLIPYSAAMGTTSAKET